MKREFPHPFSAERQKTDPEAHGVILLLCGTYAACHVLNQCRHLDDKSEGRSGSMERPIHLIAALVLLTSLGTAHAEVILLPPSAGSGFEDSDEFPESRFGDAPAHPITGRIVHDDGGRSPASESASRDVSRSPAGRIEAPV